MTPSQPRDEGSILAWPKNPESPGAGELDQQQYKAALKAHELFVGMANREDEPARRPSELDSFLPRLDAHRRNHTVLIDGTRGSGKTCVMLRLLQDWGDRLTGRTESETPLDKIKLQGGVHLVPVGLLDLEAVPNAANLATPTLDFLERLRLQALRSRFTIPASREMAALTAVLAPNRGEQDVARPWSGLTNHPEALDRR